MYNTCTVHPETDVEVQSGLEVVDDQATLFPRLLVVHLGRVIHLVSHPY